MQTKILELNCSLFSKTERDQLIKHQIQSSSDQDLVRTESLSNELQRLKESFDQSISEPYEKKERTYTQYLAFVLNNESFGFPLLNLKAVVKNQRVVPIPGGDNSLYGAINYKNQVLPVINLNHYLGFSQDELESFNILLVTKDMQFDAAFPVDQLIAIISVAQEEIQSKPLALDPNASSFINGEVFYEDKMITLLNPIFF